jgi:hypothetical protein
MERQYADHVEALRATDPELAAEFASFRGARDVLQWMKQRGLTQTAVDLISMDEFSSDFLIQLVQDGRWIAFGVT